MRNIFWDRCCNIIAAIFFIYLLWRGFYGIFDDVKYMIYAIFYMRDNQTSFTSFDFDIFYSLGSYCFIFGITFAIPILRKMYRAFPWLYPITLTILLDYVIIALGYMILSYGYQIINVSRNKMFFIIMIVQLVVCRVSMCIYFKFKPIRHI
ncbi:hypothetical protein [Anaeromicropila herbilytica]|uniref:Uncharacterized protein n=1 Tax=Anaeromicropila herbilytica TaxID=2785025 RepID=A0A7R7EJJ5_9FIRM|nr:hypothetical protein [Anaeromicropila herbilytica]BCN29870.1 hypothetical protein bsdtb5_11650 [Anaeromicropila herbilytica]